MGVCGGGGGGGGRSESGGIDKCDDGGRGSDNSNNTNSVILTGNPNSKIKGVPLSRQESGKQRATATVGRKMGSKKAVGMKSKK
jgi:hypothetical protein